MSIEYDAAIIRQFAARLYQQAARIVVTYTVGLGLLGFLGGAAVGVAASREVSWFGGVIGALLFGYVGYVQGQARAFVLRLQAQEALCQVQIEENTSTKVPR